MSRTVRTTPPRLRTLDGPAESMSLYDLRYSYAELARAAREGRRPAPARTLRRVTSWQCRALYCRKNWFPAEVATAESRARRRTRLATHTLRGLHRAAHDLTTADNDFDVDIDIPPTRHRHGALWNAW